MAVKLVKRLEGDWPSWHGEIVNSAEHNFVSIYIRYGECRIGAGKTLQEAWDSEKEILGDNDAWGGVSDIETAIETLRANDYKVETILVEQHVPSDESRLLAKINEKIGQ